MLVNDKYKSIITAAVDGGYQIRTRNASCHRTTGLSHVFNSTPLITLRKTAWKTALREMEWFLSGSSNIHTLHPSVHKWWQPWANTDGEVTHNYSAQFRDYQGAGIKPVDQIEYLLDAITNHPNSRRSVITTWNTADMLAPETPITNCHGTVIQCFVNPDNSLDMIMYQRSADVICGLPHNLIQYWALLMWLAHRTGRVVGKFQWIGGDVHVYDSHLLLAAKIYGQDDMPVPELLYNPTSEEFKADDFTLSEEPEWGLTDRAKMIV